MCAADRRRTSILAVLLALTGWSCGPWHIGGTYDGYHDPGPAVTYGELGDYLRGRTGGLITPAFEPEDPRVARLTFRADPFEQRRLVAPAYTTHTEIQGLFRFDEEGFVQRAGAPDFLAAVRAVYERMPFDLRRHAPVRPYRTPASWGGLLFPPITRPAHPVGFYHKPFTVPPPASSTVSAYLDSAFQAGLDSATQTELTAGNRLRLLFNGVQAYPEKLRLAGEARKFLYVAVMAIVADSTGRALITTMVNRKRAGVDVRVIVDDFYTFSISSFAAGILEKEGIPVARVADKRLNQFDRMFHNKFWIRDGEEAILGGMNILDYENTATGFDFQNRDTDILFSGPAVTSLLESFVGLWKRYDRAGHPIAEAESLVVRRKDAERAAGVRGSEHYGRWFANPSMRMNGICRVAVQGDDAEPQNIVALLTRYAAQARQSFYVKSPGIECEPDGPRGSAIDVLAGVLRDRCRQPGFRGTFITNGADGGWGESTIFLRSRVWDSELVGDPAWVDIMTPVIDGGGREVAMTTRAMTRPFLEAGAEVYQYMNYVHAKEFYFDRLLIGVSSWNFDSYSADNNHESAIFCLDDGLRAQFERQLVIDMINSVPLIHH